MRLFEALCSAASTDLQVNRQIHMEKERYNLFTDTIRVLTECCVTYMGKRPNHFIFSQSYWAFTGAGGRDPVCVFDLPPAPRPE